MKKKNGRQIVFTRRYGVLKTGKGVGKGGYACFATMKCICMVTRAFCLHLSANKTCSGQQECQSYLRKKLQESWWLLCVTYPESGIRVHSGSANTQYPNLFCNVSQSFLLLGWLGVCELLVAYSQVTHGLLE